MEYTAIELPQIYVASDGWRTADNAEETVNGGCLDMWGRILVFQRLKSG